MASKYFQPQIIANVAELQSFDGDKIRPNSLVHLRDGINQNGFQGPSRFRFVAGATAVDATAQLILNPIVGSASGQWQCVDPFFVLQFNSNTITSALANNATLFTVPTGYRIAPVRFVLEVGTSWTGGTNSAIGISSDNAAYNTAGDLFGGAGGNVAADLTTGGFRGTNGTKMAAMYATQPPVVLVAGNVMRWNRIVDAFAAGNGVLSVPCWRCS
jgi:hypothetical protein